MAGKVGISFFIDFDTLNTVENEIEGRNRSEKIRHVIELGLKQNLHRKAATKGHGT